MRWTPRVMAFALVLFLGMFSLDAFDGTQTLRDAILAFAIHLIPAAIVLIAAVLSWNREWIGAVAFTGMAVAYAIAAPEYPSWIVVVSGSLLFVGVAYGWAWTRRRAAA